MGQKAVGFCIGGSVLTVLILIVSLFAPWHARKYFTTVGSVLELRTFISSVIVDTHKGAFCTAVKLVSGDTREVRKFCDAFSGRPWIREFREWFCNAQEVPLASHLFGNGCT